MSNAVSAFPTWWAFCMRPENDGSPLHDTPGDSGGWTAWGVTWATYQANAAPLGLDPSFAAFQALTQDQAGQIAKPAFWDGILADRMPPAAAVVWMDFHWGSGGGSACLQRLLGVSDDGAVGPVTLAALQAAFDADPAGLLARMTAARDGYYDTLGADVPPDAQFVHGWKRRAADCAVVAATLLPGGMG